MNGIQAVQPTDVCISREDLLKYNQISRKRCYRNMLLFFVGGIVAGTFAWFRIIHPRTYE
jgi:hypothetical protein